MSVTGDNKLPSVTFQLFNRVEKFFLNDPLAPQETHVIDNEYINRAKPLPEPGQRMRSQSTRELIGKLLRRQEYSSQFRMSSTDLAVNPFSEMSFPGSDAAVEKQRAVPFPRPLTDLPCSRQRKFAARAGDKI